MVRLLPLAFLLGIVLLSFGGQLGTALPSSIDDSKELSPGAQTAGDSEEPDSSNFLLDDDDDTDDYETEAELVVELEESDEDDDDDDDGIDFADDSELVDDGIKMPVKELSAEELLFYLDLEDKIFLAETDEFIARKLIEDRLSLASPGQRERRKRVAPWIGRAAWAVGRHLFRRFSRTGVTRSGSRVTRHYTGRGNYRDAVRDFNRMRPDNVRTFNNGQISGRTGTLGPNRHRVTVRDGSSPRSGNRPTLEIRSHNGDLVRKMRYD